MTALEAMMQDFENWCDAHGYSRNLKGFSMPIAEFTLSRMGYQGEPEPDTVQVVRRLDEGATR